MVVERLQVAALAQRPPQVVVLGRELVDASTKVVIFVHVAQVERWIWFCAGSSFGSANLLITIPHSAHTVSKTFL
jgi:hypothetical protein